MVWLLILLLSKSLEEERIASIKQSKQALVSKHVHYVDISIYVDNTESYVYVAGEIKI
jgi:beta-galactosidase beta subunit